MVARRVRWRSAPVRRPPVSRRRRSPSRSTRSAWRQRSDCARPPARWRAACRRGDGRSPRPRRGGRDGSNVGETARARSLNSSAPGPVGIQGCHRDELFVARRRAPPGRWRAPAHLGHRSAMAWASSAAPSMTCSQLSRTSSAGRDCRAATIDWVRVRPGRSSVTRSVSATARGTSLDEAMSASSTSHAPHRWSTSARCAAASASRVLPIPPGPTNVTTGDRARASATASRSVSRPMSRPDRSGRFPRRPSSVRSGGCSPRPSWTERCPATSPSRR